VKDPHLIIIRPHITERTMSLSMGDPRIQDNKDLVRKYTFVVAPDANKIEIKQAIESIYNAGKKKNEAGIAVTSVRTIKSKGKTRRVSFRFKGKRPDWKKAIVTLAPGQMLEDYGV
jgi:large subunit ribosomal protein L23